MATQPPITPPQPEPDSGGVPITPPKPPGHK